MEKQNRFKSKAAWAAVAELMLFVLKNYGLLAPLVLQKMVKIEGSTAIDYSIVCVTPLCHIKF